MSHYLHSFPTRRSSDLIEVWSANKKSRAADCRNKPTALQLVMSVSYTHLKAKVYPVLHGSAMFNIGINELLDAISSFINEMVALRQEWSNEISMQNIALFLSLIHIYHAQRMAMDSMLCRFKATYPAERIDSCLLYTSRTTSMPHWTGIPILPSTVSMK